MQICADLVVVVGGVCGVVNGVAAVIVAAVKTVFGGFANKSWVARKLMLAIQP